MSDVDNAKSINKVNGSRANNNEVLLGGLTYIKNQRTYLMINAIVPIYCIIVQAMNLIFTFSFILRVEEIPDEFRRPRTPFFLLDALTPSLLFIVFIISSVINLYFLLRWRKSIYQYEIQQQIPSPSKGNITLTQLFYNIIDIMENLKRIFIVLNVLFLFYLQWFFRFFSNQLYWNGGGKAPPSGLVPVESVIMPWLNVIFQILLLIYIFMNWRHFIRWNKKLAKLKNLERQIYKELELESELLLIYGDEQDLKEVKQLLDSQKQKFRFKSATILDNEEFKQRFRDIIKDSEEVD
ncbi:MAG: hypothetical protein ACFFFH_17285 [Candidatus Thorarchaeota archaeon]